MDDIIQISKSEYEDMKEYMERLQETVDVISNENTMRKLIIAVNRIESGDYLTKEELF